jgi:hypothetical protein
MISGSTKYAKLHSEIRPFGALSLPAGINVNKCTANNTAIPVYENGGMSGGIGNITSPETTKITCEGA